MKNKKILIIGHLGGKNIGDDAMLLGLLNGLKKFVIPNSITLMVKNKYCEPIFNQFAQIEPSLLGFLRAIAKCDILILSGGTHFEDAYSKLRYLRHFRYMTFFAISTIIAKFCLKRTLWLGQGFGPINKFSTKLLLTLTLNFTDYISLRDRDSLNYFNILKDTPRINHSFDLAFYLWPIFNQKIIKDRKILGISLTNIDNRTNNQISVFYHELPQAINNLLINDGTLFIKIFEFRGGTREDDSNISNYLLSNIKSDLKARVSYIKYSENIIDFIYSVNQCRFFLTSRFHSLLIAYMTSANVGVIPYHKKLFSLANEICLDKRAIFDLQSNINSDTILAFLNELILNNNSSFTPKLNHKEAYLKSVKNFDFFFNE